MRILLKSLCAGPAGVWQPGERDKFPAITVTIPPAAEPIALAEVKLHLRVDGTGDDSQISAMLTAARQYCESVTGRAIASQTFKASYDGFPNGRTITLPRSPVSGVESVTYYDSTGAQQTLAAGSYIVDTESIPARLVLADTASWPSTYSRPNAVSITFAAGYTECPRDLEQAVLLLVGHWYANRETVNIGNITSALAFTLDAILATYKVWL
jgi:uncharacterized phiE125 gp8 family phage protein